MKREIQKFSYALFLQAGSNSQAMIKFNRGKQTNAQLRVHFIAAVPFALEVSHVANQAESDDGLYVVVNQCHAFVKVSIGE